MEKIPNQKAWFLVLPVFALVAFSAVIPLMTVVNYSVQDTFGNNAFFWNGVGWYHELLDPSTELGGRFFASLWRNLAFSAVVLVIEIPLGIVVALAMPRAGWGVAFSLVVLALPLLIPWNVVGTIWQIFGRSDIGLMGWALETRPELLHAAIEAHPFLISISFGSPAPYMQMVHQQGIYLATQVHSQAEAIQATQAGVDLIVVQGTEAGGHTGHVGTLPLLQSVLGAVQVPVLVAGGIATPRGVAAALAAGTPWKPGRRHGLRRVRR